MAGTYTFPEKKDFAWQEDYWAFEVSKPLENSVIKYIRDQQKHHKKRSFKEEFIELLKNMVLNMTINIFGNKR